MQLQCGPLDSSAHFCSCCCHSSHPGSSLLTHLLLLLLLLFCLQYTWPEFIGADLSKVTLMDALGQSSWDSSRR
jgi:hypothetical protein